MASYVNEMVRPLKYEMLGAKKIMRVPEEAAEIERLYAPLNDLMLRGERPKDIIRGTERLLTVLSRLPEKDDVCEILSSFCEHLEER